MTIDALVARLRRLICVTLAGAAGALAVTGAASAHATVSPPVAQSKALQVFTLSVPTEKENATTTQIELTVPSGFAIDSFAPPPAPWKQHVQSTGTGENAVVQKVTWTGGHTPSEQDAVFQFNASTDSSRTYTFHVRQTYSDGSVVDWTGPESSDTPAPTVKAVSDLGSGGSGTSTLAIVALIVGGIGVVLGIAALLIRGGRSLA
jgi:uncharacterized protein YcnI